MTNFSTTVAIIAKLLVENFDVDVDVFDDKISTIDSSNKVPLIY